MLLRTALQTAVEDGRLDLIETLIEVGARIDAPAAEDSGATAIQRAAIKGYLPIVRHLVDLGADVNEPAAIRRGRTALQGAAEINNDGSNDTATKFIITESAWRKRTPGLDVPGNERFVH